MLFQLGLETLEQCKGIGGTAGESGQHLILVQTPHLAGVGLEHGVAQRDLTVATKHNLGPASHAEYGGAMCLIHA